MRSKLTKFISMMLAVVLFCGVIPFAVTADAYHHYEGISMVRSYADIEAEYDKFIYLAEEVYEEDADGHLILTDYYVQPGDWLTYRLYIKSDLYIGNSMPYTAYDNRFFDVTICTDYPALGDNGYETLNDNAPKNPDHPMVENQKLYHSLTSKPANGVSVIKRGYCELDIDTATLDITMNQWTNLYPVYVNVFTSDEWLLEWKVQVKDDLAEGTRGISQIYYNMFKYSKRSDTGVADSRRPADISSADCATDVPVWDTSVLPLYNKVKSMYVNRDLIRYFLVEDTYMEFTIGENPAYDDPYEECEHRYEVDEVIDATCTKNGVIIYSCYRCGDSYGEAIPSDGHTEGDWKFELNKGTTSEGNRIKRCTKCNVALDNKGLGITILAPNPSTLNIGDSTWLHAEILGEIPENWEIVWSTDNENFVITEITEDGKSCNVSSSEGGKTVFSASIVDENGNAVVTDEQEMTAETSIIQKIVDFFKGMVNDTMEFFNLILGLLGL